MTSLSHLSNMKSSQDDRAEVHAQMRRELTKRYAKVNERTCCVTRATWEHNVGAPKIRGVGSAVKLI